MQKINLKLIGLFLLLAVIAGVFYILGVQTRYGMLFEGEYIKYVHKVFHIGSPVFEIEIPSNWSAHTQYGKSDRDLTIINLGPAQNIRDGQLNDFVPIVEITIVKNEQLASIDPKDWSSQDQSAILGGTPVDDSWKNIKVNIINAKKVKVSGLTLWEVVYFTKDGVIFSISHQGEEQQPLEHILSTLKIIDTSYL